MRETILALLNDPDLTVGRFVATLVSADLLGLPASIVCAYGAARYGFPLAVAIIGPTQLFSTLVAGTIARAGRRVVGRRGAEDGPAATGRLRSIVARVARRPAVKWLSDRLDRPSDITIFAALLVAPKGITGYVLGGATDYPLRRYLFVAVAGVMTNVTLKVAWEATAARAYLMDNGLLLIPAGCVAALAWLVSRWARNRLDGPNCGAEAGFGIGRGRRFGWEFRSSLTKVRGRIDDATR